MLWVVVGFVLIMVLGVVAAFGLVNTTIVVVCVCCWVLGMCLLFDMLMELFVL